MGKGDKRSKHGKIVSGTFGVSRPHKPVKGNTATTDAVPKKAAKKSAKNA